MVRLKRLYSYLNLESTKTLLKPSAIQGSLYSYLNLESTKTEEQALKAIEKLYSYLNLESTKTRHYGFLLLICCTVT